MLSRLLQWINLRTTHADTMLFRYQTEFGPYLHKNRVDTSESFYQTIVKKAAKYINSKSVVLEAGCGFGRIAIDMGNLGAKEVIGIDTNKDYIFEAKAIAGNHRNHILSYPCQGNYSFQIGDIHSLTFADNYFSLALCINVIDRIKAPHLALQELHRVLQKGGVLVLADPYHWMDVHTPRQFHVNNMKDLLSKKDWTVLYEDADLPYNIYINPRLTLAYKNHLLILKKNQC